MFLTFTPISLSRAVRWGAGLSAMAAAVVLTGCAHPISMAPDVAKISSTASPINKTAAYVISASNLAKEVETPGGGGDNVKYSPYRDLDPGLYKALSQVFPNVVRLSSLSDPAIAAQNVAYVIEPQVTTSSSSSNPLTWPPTQFTVEINAKVFDAQGKLLTTVRGAGEGQATFSEYASDFGVAGKRASNAALDQLIKGLSESSELRR